MTVSAKEINFEAFEEMKSIDVREDLSVAMTLAPKEEKRE